MKMSKLTKESLFKEWKKLANDFVEFIHTKRFKVFLRILGEIAKILIGVIARKIIDHLI